MSVEGSIYCFVAQIYAEESSQTNSLHHGQNQLRFDGIQERWDAVFCDYTKILI